MKLRKDTVYVSNQIKYYAFQSGSSIIVAAEVRICYDSQYFIFCLCAVCQFMTDRVKKRSTVRIKINSMYRYDSCWTELDRSFRCNNCWTEQLDFFSFLSLPYQTSSHSNCRRSFRCNNCWTEQLDWLATHSNCRRFPSTVPNPCRTKLVHGSSSSTGCSTPHGPPTLGAACIAPTSHQFYGDKKRTTTTSPLATQGCVNERTRRDNPCPTHIVICNSLSP